MANTNYINQYLEFLKPERRVAKNQMKQGNIYRIVRYGNDTARPTSPEQGLTRFNTQRGYLESWNGTQWVLAAGGGESVTEEYAENINFLWNLILG